MPWKIRGKIDEISLWVCHKVMGGSMGGVTWVWAWSVDFKCFSKLKNLMQWSAISCISDAVREKSVLFMKLCVSDVFRGVLA